jgi:hypothetical protein
MDTAWFRRPSAEWRNVAAICAVVTVRSFTAVVAAFFGRSACRTMALSNARRDE